MSRGYKFLFRVHVHSKHSNGKIINLCDSDIVGIVVGARWVGFFVCFENCCSLGIFTHTPVSRVYPDWGEKRNNEQQVCM